MVALAVAVRCTPSVSVQNLQNISTLFATTASELLHSFSAKFALPSPSLLLCALTALSLCTSHQLVMFSAARQILPVPKSLWFIHVLTFFLLAGSFLLPRPSPCFFLSQICSIGVDVSQYHMLLGCLGCWRLACLWCWYHCFTLQLRNSTFPSVKSSSVHYSLSRSCK